MSVVTVVVMVFFVITEETVSGPMLGFFIQNLPVDVREN